VQAQPTADEVKEEIIQPLADKVKAEAIPAAERLTREQLQPAAEQAAEQLDAGAQQLTEEVMKPAAEVRATIHLLKCPSDRCSAVHVSVRLVLPHVWNAVVQQAADITHCHRCELLATPDKAFERGRWSARSPCSTAPSEAVPVASQAFAESVEPATQQVSGQVRTIGKDIAQNAEPQAEVIAEQVNQT
jgi:hypothetical protein